MVSKCIESNSTIPPIRVRWRAPRFAQLAFLAASCCVATWSGTIGAEISSAQDPKPEKVPERLADREPFDRLILDAANANFKADIFALPQLRSANKIDKSKPLRIRLLSRPTQEFDVNWQNIAKVELFEDMMLEEAGRLTRDKRFEEAFEYLDKVYRREPRYPNLRDAIEVYLYLNAEHYRQQRRFPEALSLLEELFKLNPNFRQTPTSEPLGIIIEKSLDEIISKYMEAQDYAGARNMLIRVATTYGERQKSTVDKWRGQLVGLASTEQQKARQLLNQGKPREALATTNEMMRIWPEVAGGLELAKEMAERYPLVIVGVAQRATVHDSDLLDNWAARRTGRLVSRRLCEFVGKGPEGGRYESPLGTIESSDDGRQITFTLRTDENQPDRSLTGYDVAKRLLALADPKDPTYSSAWGSLMQNLTVLDVNQVQIELRRPHVLPESLLQTTLRPTEQGGAITSGASAGAYLPAEASAAETRFLVNRQSPFFQPRQPKEIIERLYEKTDKAITALKRGDVDVLDRVFPADVFRLRNDKTLVVGQYAVPSVHVLVPNYKKPFPAHRTFRRAILYAINRQGILTSELLGGVDLPGCVVLSGPLPAGLGSSDPLAYAYDERIVPRPYDPRLGLTLIKLTEIEMANAAKKAAEAAEKKDKPTGDSPATNPAPDPAAKPDAAAQPEPVAKPDAAAKPEAAGAPAGPKIEIPTLGKLVIGHPPTEMARIACQAIVMQLGVIKLEVELLELPPDKLSDPEGKCDFVYRELLITEPVAQAPQLVGIGGLFAESSQYVGLALRRLEATNNWRDASISLKDLHRIIYDDTTVLPLWQLTDYYAHRAWVRGLTGQPVSLYQNIEHWQISLRTGIE